MTNENNTITRTQLEEALAEWCLQWTTEFIESHVLPNVNKALENEVVIFDLINWKKLNDRYQREKKAEFIKSIISGKSEFTQPIIDDRRRYGDNLYDFFAKICK